MSGSNTGKYLKYAIGEIMLVVAGILIALSINNWNEENKKSIEAKEYLQSLLDEFEANHTDLKTKIEFHESVKLKTKELSDLMNPRPKNVASDYLDSLMFAMVYFPEYRAITSQMESDKLDLVNDYRLKNDIAVWKLTYESYLVGLQLTRDQFISNVSPFINTHYQLKNMKSTLFTNDQSAFPVNANTILSSPVFENYVKIRSVNTSSIYMRASKLFDLQESLIQSIEQKLEDS